MYTWEESQPRIFFFFAKSLLCHCHRSRSFRVRRVSKFLFYFFPPFFVRTSRKEAHQQAKQAGWSEKRKNESKREKKGKQAIIIPSVKWRTLLKGQKRNASLTLLTLFFHTENLCEWMNFFLLVVFVQVKPVCTQSKCVCIDTYTSIQSMISSRLSKLKWHFCKLFSLLLLSLFLPSLYFFFLISFGKSATRFRCPCFFFQKFCSSNKRR